MSEATIQRIAALGHLCEAAAASAAASTLPAVARFHRETAEYFSQLAFMALQS